MDKYLNQDIFNPKYLFHGSPYLLEELEPRKSTDIINTDNEDTAIFLTSWFLNASAYAFRNKLKEYNEYYNFSINNDGELPVMKYEVNTIPDNLYGYIYVFEKNDDIIRDDHGNINRKTTQYKCHNKLKPIDVIKINFKDYEKYFELNKKYIKK